jgi:hypothetical protein
MHISSKFQRANLFTWDLDAKTETLSKFSDFYGEGTAVDQTCSLLFRGQMIIIGGYPDYKQISYVNGCEIKRSSVDLPMNTSGSLCTAYNDGNDAIYCDDNECYKFLGDGKFERIQDTEFYHMDGAMTTWRDR